MQYLFIFQLLGNTLTKNTRSCNGSVPYRIELTLGSTQTPFDAKIIKVTQVIATVSNYVYCLPD